LKVLSASTRWTATNSEEEKAMVRRVVEERVAGSVAASSLRELDAVALATNVTIFMERDTKEEELACDRPHVNVLLGGVFLCLQRSTAESFSF
jgi:hypothetical protein